MLWRGGVSAFLQAQEVSDVQANISADSLGASLIMFGIQVGLVIAKELASAMDTPSGRRPRRPGTSSGFSVRSTCERFMSYPLLLQVMDECNHCELVQFQQGPAGDSLGDEQHCEDRCFSL